MRTLLPPALLTCWLLAPVNSIHPECRFHLEIQEEETKCAALLRSPTEQYKGHTKGFILIHAGGLKRILDPHTYPLAP
uniref:Vasoactive intestinal peptide receptor 2 n=1 Tax=Rhinopithecus bieti TaxID=61621 RepID=A0A2K6MRS4_RHIBE